MTIYDYVWSNNRWISADAVAKPPRGAEIAAHVPPDPPGMSFNEYLACLKYGDGVNGKYAADFDIHAFQIAFRKKYSIAIQQGRMAKLDAERAKLVATRAGSSATTFTGQLAVAGHSGISPEGGGLLCLALVKTRRSQN